MVHGGDADHGHEPVLVEELLALLSPRPGETVVDCTCGRGGHATRLAEAVVAEAVADGPGRPGPPPGLVIGFDLDPANLAHTRDRVEAAGGRFEGYRQSFVGAPARLTTLDRPADIVLADLGFSSTQMDDPGRGFSFRLDGPLDMRYDPDGPTTAADLLACLSEPELTQLLREYGEDPLAAKIARKLVRTRRRKPIQTTAELAHVVLEAYGGRARASRIHPATRTFMALRIAVNQELEALQALLDATAREAGRVGGAGGGGWLRTGARVAIISFHSLEDRLVKRAFADLVRGRLAARLTDKPRRAGAAEVERNPRARSARLRAIRIGPPRQDP